MKKHIPAKQPNTVTRLPGGIILPLAAILMLASCRTADPGLYRYVENKAQFELDKDDASPGPFELEKRAGQKAYADRDTIGSFSSQMDDVYRMGPGDAFEFIVRGRADVSVPDVVVSPDGKVSLPRAGIIDVEGKSLEEVTNAIKDRLRHFYDEPEVTLVMKNFNNNKVYVLGRVANPGVVNFHGRGNLLEALSLAGGLPVDTTRSWLSRCMIVRGSDQIIWVDLRDLLDNGNMALNAKLRNGDVIYIPQSMDQVAYVMGEVETPGVLQLRSDMTLLDAIMYRGGPTDNASHKHIYLVRSSGQHKGRVEEINLKEMYAKADLRKNYVLKDGDIVFVPRHGMAKYNYVIEQLQPTLSVLDFTLDAAESLGALDGYTE